MTRTTPPAYLAPGRGESNVRMLPQVCGTGPTSPLLAVFLLLPLVLAVGGMMVLVRLWRRR